VHAIRERGGRPALNPAEANMLVVAGASPSFEPYVARVWQAMAAPKVRVAGDLDAALATLHDATEQRRQARAHHVPTPPDAHAMNHGEHATSHGGGHEHHMAGMDMGGMAMPGGIPMADRAPDRDGLQLDQLHLTLGPALPLWPAGLIVHTRLQGDVIQDATVEILGGDGSSYWPERPVERHVDSLTRLLAVAGWPDANFARARRSRTLRWLLSGVGQADDAPAPLAGDVVDRLYRRLDALTAGEPLPEEPQWTVDHLPNLLTGTELATARLIVASFDPDLDLLAHHGAHHG